MVADPWSWYAEIPIASARCSASLKETFNQSQVSRLYLTVSFMTTAACETPFPSRPMDGLGALDLVSPLSLYYDFALIFRKGEAWRLVSNFFFFGMDLDFLFHMYFLVRYCRLLEEGEFRGRTRDFVGMLVFGAFLMLLLAPFVETVNFLGSSLAFMMVYVWGRRNEHVRMSFLGLFPFTAPYLPWVMLAFSILLGNPATTDLIGIAVGHTYFYLEYIYPVVAGIRGWPPRILAAPPFLATFLAVRPLLVVSS